MRSEEVSYTCSHQLVLSMANIPTVCKVCSSLTYDDFLWATQISSGEERVQQMYVHIGELPRANFDLLERLVFHLARVAQQESANRMTANSLANKSMQMQDKLQDIAKQTSCIELIISERMSQIASTLGDIDILSTACHTASSRLLSLRLSRLHLNQEVLGSSQAQNHNQEDRDADEEAILAQQIQHLITEKNHLTEMLPSFRLANAGSDEDMLSLDAESADCEPLSQSEESVNFILQSAQSTPSLSHLNTITANPSADQRLNHLTKNRVSVPNRRKPSKFTTNGGSNGDQRNSDSTDYVNQYLDNDKPVMV